jgi:D-sedoheptulose 7-phosphate isomerase
MGDAARAYIASGLSEAAAVLARLEDPPLVDALVAAAETVAAAMRSGGMVLVFGNGGSAADAAHLAAEFVGRCRVERRPLPALALADSGATVSALANDYGYDQVFARQLMAHVRPGDVAIALSTSGRSPNVLRGLEAARTGGALTVGLTGEFGGDMPPLCDHLLRAPSSITPRIQEAHQVWAHLLAEWVERESSV